MFTTIFYDDKKSHLILHNHNNYGNHSVLAVGYQKYTYKGFLGVRIKYIFGLQMAGIRDQDDMFGVDVQEHGIMFQ